MSFGLSLSRARLIAELLCNAGWLDDANENLAEVIEDEELGPPAALEKALEVDALINAVNLVLPEPEWMEPSTMATYYRILPLYQKD